MATVLDEFPYPIVTRVLRLLPVLDVINVSKVCKNWKHVASYSLKRVKIDASTAYSGCWQKYYEEKDEGARQKNYDKFAVDLADCTDEIEHFYFDGDDIPLAVFEILLSSQKQIKTLAVNLQRRDFEEIKTEIGKTIAKAIIKHEKSLEKINIGVRDVFLSLKEMADASYDKDSCFPNLRSIEFLSTTVGNFEEYTMSTDDFDGMPDADARIFIMDELKSAEVLFKKMFVGSKIEELNYKPTLALYYDDNIFWSPPFIQLLTRHFELGAFSNLRKVNIGSLNNRGIKGEFSEEDADLLIQNCPCITHIDSDLFVSYVHEYKTPQHDEMPFIKIITHYGSQLVHLHCYTNTNIAKCIVENCPNVETLTITNYFGDGLSTSAFIALSGMQKLKKVTVFFHECDSDGLISFLENCISRLNQLQICLNVTSVSKFLLNKDMFTILQENGKDLETFIFDAVIESFEDYIEIMEGFTKMLSGCFALKCLTLRLINYDIPIRDSEIQYVAKLTDQLISHHADLHHLSLNPLSDIPDEFQKKLIKAMPYCKMLFDRFHDEYVKF